MGKRLFDIIFSFLGLLTLLPLFAAVALLLKRDSEGPVFFRQERMGKNFKPFRIYKFRTMTVCKEGRGPLITVANDTRITRFGSFLRKSKIDELPQLLNILKGDMSLVGPRPEVEKYVQLFRPEYERLLTVRPGITDFASLRYSEEEGLLALSGNWEEEYIKKILPQKILLSLRYVEHRSIFTDVTLVVKTILKTSRTGSRQGSERYEHNSC
jgi:lipopolysaccharide/colanic/teichoic acid biosynthesis glycosyltransferase